MASYHARLQMTQGVKVSGVRKHPPTNTLPQNRRSGSDPTCSPCTQPTSHPQPHLPVAPVRAPTSPSWPGLSIHVYFKLLLPRVSAPLAQFLLLIAASLSPKVTIYTVEP